VNTGQSTGDAKRIANNPADVETTAKNSSVQENAVIVANRLLTALDAGRSAGALMLGMPVGTEANEAGALAHAGCELFR